MKQRKWKILIYKALKEEKAMESAHPTVFDNSLPISMVRRQSGIISVERRKLITSVSSTCNGRTQQSSLLERKDLSNKNGQELEQFEVSDD